MKIYREFQQRSAEWFAVRLGIPTASEAHRIITPTGKLSKQADDFMDGLLAEWMSGKALSLQDPNAEFRGMWMDRGVEYEYLAAEAYCFSRGVEVEEVGFVSNDNGLIGCSPDRLIIDGGVLEIKVPSPKTHVHYMRTGSIEDDYRPQLQMELLVTERPYVDIISYCPGYPSVILRQERDEEYREKLADALNTFVENMLKARMKLLERYPTLQQRMVAA